MEAMAVLDPRPCWRCAGSRLIGKEVRLEWEGMQETEHGILTRAALSGTMLPGSNMPLEAAQGESGRQQLGEGSGNQIPGSLSPVSEPCFIFLPNLLKRRRGLPKPGQKGGQGIIYVSLDLPASCIL